MLNVLWVMAGLIACGDKGDEDTGTASEDTGVQEDTSTQSNEFVADETRYRFLNADGESSVSYSGQVYRHLLINDVKAYVGALDGRLLSEIVVPGDVTTDLMFYYQDIKDIDVAMVSHRFSTGELGVVQSYYGDISSGKNLFEKIAGSDTVTDHKDWQTEFRGWDSERVTSPESLVLLWTEALDAQAVNWTQLSTELPHVYVTPEGLDYAQLLQKFLLGAVAFSQGADDYLDDDVVGKGLLASHIPAEGKTYSALEHAWDEGFGYFGAAQDYVTWSDQELKDNAYLDRNEDGSVDLKTEVSWGHSRNAAKRDVGANAPTDLTKDAWGAFWQGRALLNQTVGAELTTEQMTELRGYRDQALLAWEMAIVATVVHYINDSLQDITNNADLSDLAKHWSELKGFALSMQFNPHSPLSDDAFEEFHTLVGDRPYRTEEYKDALVQARTLLGDIYEIDSTNLGDENGENGW